MFGHVWTHRCFAGATELYSRLPLKIISLSSQKFLTKYAVVEVRDNDCGAMPANVNWLSRGGQLRRAGHHPVLSSPYLQNSSLELELNQNPREANQHHKHGSPSIPGKLPWGYPPV